MDTLPQKSLMLKPDVLIIGLGPVGLLMANLLGQYGYSILAVDKQTQLPNIPRAIGLDGESMRVIQQAGLTEELILHLRPHEGLHFFDAKGIDLLLR